MNCIYKLYVKNELVYIGKTGNLKSRINSHTKEKIKWKSQIDRVEYSKIPNGDMCSIYEIYYISKYKPKYNKEHRASLSIDKIDLPEIAFTEFTDRSQLSQNLDIFKVPTKYLGYLLILFKFSANNGIIRNEKGQSLKTVRELSSLLKITPKSCYTVLENLKILNILNFDGCYKLDLYVFDKLIGG